MAIKKHDDKRSVHTDALETLGMLIDKRKQGRDAIHLAVEPVTAGHQLSAGDHVGFMEDGRAGRCDSPLGIVDPFLEAPVQEGEDFWLIVYPRKITSLRHVWEHPGFEAPGVDPRKKTSEEWIKSWLEKYPSLDYEEVMRTATARAGGTWALITRGSELEGERVPEEFWDHYEIITGTTVKSDDRNSFFNCSC